MRGERIFDSYQEFYSLTRPLSEHQRETLMHSLSSSERRRLLRARKAEGWDDLMTRNDIDHILDRIREDFNEDLVLIRIRVLSGRITKVRKAFWDYVVDVFSDYNIRHTWHVFEGITVRNHSEDYYLLVPSRRAKHGKKENGG